MQSRYSGTSPTAVDRTTIKRVGRLLPAQKGAQTNKPLCPTDWVKNRTNPNSLPLHFRTSWTSPVLVDCAFLRAAGRFSATSQKLHSGFVLPKGLYLSV